MPTFAIRPALQSDLPEIVLMVRELAELEQLKDQVVLQEEDLRRELFGPSPILQALVATAGTDTAGMALFFYNFSTFLGKRGLYLEDLYVRPSFRRRGIGQALLRHLCNRACQENCGRVEWTVLDWNQPAIDFYRRAGAQVLPDWRICRISGSSLAAFSTEDRR